MSKHGKPFDKNEKTLVQQQHKLVNDPATIVQRFGDGLRPVTTKEPMYIDTFDVKDYHTSMNMVAKVSQQFQQLPAKTRKKFANSPENLLEYLADPENKEDAIKAGLIEAVETPPTPLETEIKRQKVKKEASDSLSTAKAESKD